MRKLSLRVALVAVVTLAVVALARAQQQPSAPQQQPSQQQPARQRGMAGGGPFARLNLTDQQRTDIQNAMKASREAMAKDLGELGDVRRQLHEALFADTPDEAQVSALSTRLKQIQDNLQTSRIQAQEQIAKVLTPDQRKQVRQWGAGAMMRRMGRMGGMGRMMR